MILGILRFKRFIRVLGGIFVGRFNRIFGFRFERWINRKVSFERIVESV
jgi:hypothetical protein